MKCPICQDASLLMTERMGVAIDYCPQCRGIWLDRGELDKLLGKAEQAAAAPERRPGGPVWPDQYGHGDDRHYEGHHGHGAHHSRRRSWLGNLLDFD